MSKKKQSKKEKQQSINKQTLNTYKEHVGEWICAVCASGSGQPAKVMQNLRADGYDFEMIKQGRWAKSVYCKKCGKDQSHYKLKSTEPTFAEKHRYVMSQEDRDRVFKVYGGIDAFTNTKISGIFEVDHKKPFFNEEQDINIKDLTDEEIKNEYQLLTPDHNKLKDKQCRKCVKNKKRPPFLGKKYWYVGGENFTGSCIGCGYYDGVKWTEEFNKEDARKNARNNLIQYLYKELGNNDIK